MNTILEQMLKRYPTDNLYDKRNSMKEIMQEIVLCGLSRAGFFKHAAFYGGTALRIFYGLDRFSEDLDFSLRTPDPNFDLQEFFPALLREANSFGINVSIREKEKSAATFIRSAFLKGNTKEHLLYFYGADSSFAGIMDNENIKIKLELDVNPPPYASFEQKYRLLPVPYAITLYDEPSLFAGKLHAVICRKWGNRVKGRDLYDYVFYLARGTKVNKKHLLARLAESGVIAPYTDLPTAKILELLNDRFAMIDYQQAKEDVLPFIKDTSQLELWSADFFQQIGTGLNIQ
ncbi:MAG: nucleotidyl transferase AbiEii/AbiGii toxin family protein [Phascolarctobacterium sp.]